MHLVMGVASTALSFVALLAVVRGYLQPAQADEGAAAHVFHISIVMLVPTIAIFLATADWNESRRVARRLALPALILVIAFAALYWLEAVRYRP